MQLRLADRITAFAGSMPFVWIHVSLFTAWMVLLEKYPVAEPDSGGFT